VRKLYPAATELTSKDCSIGNIFTNPEVLKFGPRPDAPTNMRSVFMVTLAVDVVKSVAVPAAFV
jgi:hypothetical protein